MSPWPSRSASTSSTTTTSCARDSRSCSSSRTTSSSSAQSATAAEATARIPALRPDVAVLDARLPDGSGIEVCRAVRAVDPTINALILTSYDDDEALFAAIMAGASGYVLKEIRSSDLVTAVRHVAAGKSLIDPAMTATVLERIRNGPEHARRAGLAHRPGADPARPHRRGADQPADRRADVPRREDGEELRLQHPRQARASSVARRRPCWPPSSSATSRADDVPRAGPWSRPAGDRRP